MKWEVLKLWIAQRVIHMFEHWTGSEAHMSGMTTIFGGLRDNRRTITPVPSPLREEAPCYVLWLFGKWFPRKQTSIWFDRFLDTQRRRGWWYKLSIEQASDLYITHTTLYSSWGIVRDRPLELAASFDVNHEALRRPRQAMKTIDSEARCFEVCFKLLIGFPKTCTGSHKLEAVIWFAFEQQQAIGDNR